jgi:AcrR family transcriptional regulator
MEPLRTRTRDPEETRRRLLEAGLELLRRDSVGNVLSQVKSAKVAREAGLTEGAFFHHWPTQAAYLEDLFDHALATDRFEWTNRVAADSLRELAEGGDLSVLTRRIAAKLVTGLSDDTSFQVQAGLWARADVDEVVAERLRRLYHDTDRRFGALFQEALESRGMRARAGHTYEEMARIANAILEGLVVRRRIDPDLVPAELLGDLILALLPHYAEPVPAPDERAERAGRSKATGRPKASGSRAGNSS